MSMPSPEMDRDMTSRAHTAGQWQQREWEVGGGARLCLCSGRVSRAGRAGEQQVG